MAARRIVPAHTIPTAHKPQPRRDGELVEANEKDENFRQDKEP